MLISNKETLKQALANIRLESLHLPKEVQEVLDKALNGEEVDTTEVINLLKNYSSKGKIDT